MLESKATRQRKFAYGAVVVPKDQERGQLCGEGAHADNVFGVRYRPPTTQKCATQVRERAACRSKEMHRA